MSKKRDDLTGKVFGRLTVIEFSHKNKHGNLHWKCKCECGTEKVVSAGDLRSGHVKSCGCLKRSKTRQNKGGVYTFKPNETQLKNKKQWSQVKKYKLSPAELEKYLEELPNKEVQCRCSRG